MAGLSTNLKRHVVSFSVLRVAVMFCTDPRCALLVHELEEIGPLCYVPHLLKPEILVHGIACR